MSMNMDFGLIGLAVMGQNLVLNVASRGYSVSVFNRNPEVTAKFVAAHPGQRLLGAKTLPEFVASLSRPRKIMLMVKAGAPVDEVVAQLLPLLEQGDIVIDGGNSKELAAPNGTWTRVWQGNRPGEHKEKFRLYRR